ncbi:MULTISPECIES: hypothetical protein [Actinomadura]|uniref:Lipoprotein n=1 Tax=Actinomadura yumaensis TaxID=111807 RepID=A0ABW2CZL7_9ACTN|nr:hypothetical protein [Actinomadura sp. J1-007]MWK34213.1 hypothetical protein [Actinomadura sp. J1-007]
MALGLTAALLAGCGDDKDTAKEPPNTPSTPKPSANGLDGTWKAINKGPITGLTIAGAKVTTTGRLACPGTITAKTITLSCANKEGRTKGTLQPKPGDATKLAIHWKGEAWGGAIDAFSRAS